jgi:hypothetical protein
MDRNTVRLAPSILAADFARLGEQVTEAEQAGADRIHVDVMDGHFVPNLSMGAPIVQSLRRVTRLPLETHMMITDPDFFLDEFTEAGSDSFLVHWEGNNNLSRTVQRIKALGKRVGVAINPATPRGSPGGNPTRRRPGAGNDSQPGFWPSTFPAHHAPQDSACPPDDRSDQARMRPGGGRGHRCDERTARHRRWSKRPGGRVFGFWFERRGSHRNETAAAATRPIVIQTQRFAHWTLTMKSPGEFQ